MVPEGVEVRVLDGMGKGTSWWRGETVWKVRLCHVAGSFQECASAISELCGSFICKNWQLLITMPNAAGMKNNNIHTKSIEFLFQGQDRIADSLIGDQLLGLWIWFCLVVLVTPNVVTSFHPSAEQSVFVNWAAGALIASSV